MRIILYVSRGEVQRGYTRSWWWRGHHASRMMMGTYSSRFDVEIHWRENGDMNTYEKILFMIIILDIDIENIILTIKSRHS
jgi:hypothetical protein